MDLVMLASQRTYRCRDREYVRAARAVDGDEQRDRLREAQRSDSPSARRHASYVLSLLDRPETPNTRHVWRTWLSGTPTPGEKPPTRREKPQAGGLKPRA